MKNSFFIFLSFLFTFSTLVYALDNKNPIKIGWIGPLSGSASILGVDSVPAIELVVREINASGGIHGRAVKLVVEDDQYVTKKTVSAYQKFVHQEGIKVIIVLTYGGLFAIAPQAEKDGVILIDPLDCDEQIAKLPQNTFCITKRTEDLGRTNAEHAIAQNNFPAGIIYYDGDPFMGIAAEATALALKKSGRDWALSETYNDTNENFRSILTRAKSLNLRSLFFYGYDPMGTAMREARNLGINATFYTLATSTSSSFQKLAGEALEDVYFPSWKPMQSGAYDQFLKLFKAKVGRAPYFEISTVPSFDIGYLLKLGLSQGALDGKGAVDITKLRDFFYSQKNYFGASGPITMDADGITRSFQVQLFRWKNGEPEKAL